MELLSNSVSRVLLFATLAPLLVLLYRTIATLTSPVITQGVLHQRKYFYAGLRYSLNGDTSFAYGQIYVEHLRPAIVTQTYPLVIIHGSGMTGTNFLNTPDGRLGWADYLLGKGFEIFLLDQPSRGRSPWNSRIDGDQIFFDTATIEARFTATRRHKIWPQALLHTQWPGNGSIGDPIFDAFYAGIMPTLMSGSETSLKMKYSGTQLLENIGSVILITHSQSGQFGWILADSRPNHIKAILALEPSGPPFVDAVFPPRAPARPYGLTEIPVEYIPPINSPSDLHVVTISNNSYYTCYGQEVPARKMVNLLNIPVRVITSESGYHAVYDDCTVNYLRQAGVTVDHIKLHEHGFRGNGHMMFMEKNNLEIVERVVVPWLRSVSHK